MTTTLVPFSTLPSCASQCGALYDAQGACVPPAVPTSNLATYTSCFCDYSELQAFKTGTTGVTNCLCSDDSTGLQQIQNWYLGFCGLQASGTSSGSAATATATRTSLSSNSGGGNPTWMSTHWKWVVMLVVVFVGIVVIWIGAWLLRRRYLRKREREIELRGPVALGPHQHHIFIDPATAAAGARGGKGKDRSRESEKSAAGLETMQPSKKPKEKKLKKWIVKERT